MEFNCVADRRICDTCETNAMAPNVKVDSSNEVILPSER